MITNLYYFNTISPIGGIETFFYQLAKKYKDIDLVIVYRHADPAQLKRLKQYVRCEKFTGQNFVCEKAFFNFNTDIIDNVQAEEYVLVIHGDYKTMHYQGQIGAAPNHPKINRYIGVSQIACDAFTEMTGKPCELSYNPFLIEKSKKVLHLISATRLTREKGKARMEKLAKALTDAGIPFLWTVFTNDTNAIDNPNVIYMKPRLDILDYIADADYLVQLSDNEGYCYSAIEALSAGTPVIVTPCPVFNELGIEDGKNGYILDFEMNNIPIDKIYNNIPKFNYEVPKDNWNKILINKKSKYEEDKKKMYKVKALKTYKEKRLKDKDLGRIPKPGEEWSVSFDRLQFLLGENDKKLTFVKLIGEE